MAILSLKQKILSVFSVQLLTIFLASQPAHAAPLLTELHPAPASGQPEWIELHNPDPEPINLTGWQLWDELSTPSLLLTLSTTLEPGQITTFDLPSAKLNNAADGVTLRSTTGQIIDSFSYTTTEAAKSWLRSGQTWQLGEPTPNSYQASEPTPTPSPTPTPTPSPTPYPSPAPSSNPTPPPTSPTPTPTQLPQLALLQLNPCPPTGQTESVTIKNTGQTLINLDQITIRDEQHNTRTTTGQLTPDAQTTIQWATAMLNNTGDTVSILAVDGSVLASAQYTECQTGQVLHLIDNEWQAISPAESASPTPSPTPVASPIPTVLGSTQASISTTTTNPILRNHTPKLQPPQLGSSTPTHTQPHTPPAANTLEYVQRVIPRTALLSVILGSALLLTGGAVLQTVTQSAQPKHTQYHV